MKILFLILGLIGASGSVSAQVISKTDLWSGTYAVRLVAKNGSIHVETPFKQPIIIQSSQSDPSRWISPNGEGGTDLTMKEFSFGLDGKEDEHK
ncbi:MAG TPA: hypothetical protein VK325_00815 [Pseudoxanthomonas sp.]|nr:hypothetical protein [Pseudoxanthomonas sp.]